MNKKERKQLRKMVAHGTIQEKIFNGVRLYPPVEEVLEDEELACLFRPVLTVQRTIKNKEYIIHALLSLGVFDDPLRNNLFSEGHFFGFAYNGGKYKYLGSREIAGSYAIIRELYRSLQVDFEKRKEVYLLNKTTIEEYVSTAMNLVSDMIEGVDRSRISYYLEGFYGYELTKYHYQVTGNLKGIMEITEKWKQDINLILSEKEFNYVIEEFFVNLKHNLSNSYNISPDMVCFGIITGIFRGISGPQWLVTLVDNEKDLVYMLEYCS